MTEQTHSNPTSLRLGWRAVAFAAVAAIPTIWNLSFFTLFATSLPTAVQIVATGRDLSEIDASLLFGWLALGALPILYVVAIGLVGFQRAVELAYGVQAPLISITILRLAGARSGTPVTNLTFAIGVFGMVMFAWAVVQPAVVRWRSGAALLTPTLLSGVWLALLLGVLVPPAVVGLVDQLGELLFSLGRLEPMLFVGLSLVAITLAAVLLVPLAVMVLYASTWFRAVRAGGALAVATTVVTTIALVGAVWSLSEQPQAGVFERLEPAEGSPYAQTSPRDRAQWITANEDRVRSGLVNAVLSPYRYLAARGELTGLAAMYERNGFPESLGNAAQSVHSVLLSAMLYDGPSATEHRADARRLYVELFDENIEAAHREAFRDALIQTWSFRQPDATLLDAAAKTVHLTRQSVQIEEHGPVADVMVHETYENRTFASREVLYHFSLPETAVVTGLWIGPEDDRDRAFKFRVSPRGAAQEVYKAQVRRSVDPALLEQVGPRQYRLRIFPIERARDLVGGPGRGPPMHMWLRYRTRPVDGRWPMPQLLESRNVYWDARTKRSVDGVPARVGPTAWFPPGPESPPQSVTHGAVTIAGHEVRFAPASRTPDTVPGRWVVALDTSWSMRAVADDVRQALKRLATVLPADTELIVTRSPYLQEAPAAQRGFELEPVSWFGGLSLRQVWRQVATTAALEGATGVVILTDAGDGVLEKGALDQPPTLPVWFVHLGGRPAIGYDDRMLEALQQAGGGVALSVDEALARMAQPNRRQADGHTIEIVALAAGPEPTASQIQSGDDQSPTKTSAALRPLAAKWLIEARAPAANGDAAQLDRWHTLAKSEGIATPFSSMIVLVNKQQHKQLDRAEAAADRFAREAEDGQTQARVGDSGFPSSDLTAVPEPSTWLLLLVGLGGAWAVRRRQAIERL